MGVYEHEGDHFVWIMQVHMLNMQKMSSQTTTDSHKKYTQ